MGGHLYIGGISRETSEATLLEWLTERGLTIRAVHVVRNGSTGLGRGFAFAELDDADAARAAIDVLDGQSVEGQFPHFKTVPFTAREENEHRATLNRRRESVHGALAAARQDPAARERPGFPE